MDRALRLHGTTKSRGHEAREQGQATYRGRTAIYRPRDVVATGRPSCRAAARSRVLSSTPRSPTELSEFPQRGASSGRRSRLGRARAASSIERCGLALRGVAASQADQPRPQDAVGEVRQTLTGPWRRLERDPPLAEGSGGSLTFEYTRRAASDQSSVQRVDRRSAAAMRRNLAGQRSVQIRASTR